MPGNVAALSVQTTIFRCCGWKVKARGLELLRLKTLNPKRLTVKTLNPNRCLGVLASGRGRKTKEPSAEPWKKSKRKTDRASGFRGGGF